MTQRAKAEQNAINSDSREMKRKQSLTIKLKGLIYLNSALPFSLLADSYILPQPISNRKVLRDLAYTPLPFDAAPTLQPFVFGLDSVFEVAVGGFGLGFRM